MYIYDMHVYMSNVLFTVSYIQMGRISRGIVRLLHRVHWRVKLGTLRKDLRHIIEYGRICHTIVFRSYTDVVTETESTHQMVL